MGKIIDWLRASNRWKHLVYAVPCGLLLGLPFVIGLASGMEFKGKAWGGAWDWADWALTVFGASWARPYGSL